MALRRHTSAPIAGIGLALAVAFVLGCDGRDHTNPLDPENDQTNGHPDVLRAIADNAAVDLFWSAVPPNGFAAYELHRSEAGSAFELVRTTTEVGDVTHRDEARTNGRSLRYRLDIVLGDGSRVALPEKEATPGSSAPWVLENAPFGAVRVTPDGRTVRARSRTFGVFYDADVDPDGGVFAADYFGEAVVRVNPAGERTHEFSVPLPFRIAVDSARERVWVGSWRSDADPVLYAFDFDGIEEARFPASGEARDLLVDPSTGACYLALGRGGGVARAEVDGELAVFAAETMPMLLARVGDEIVCADPFARALHAFDLSTLVETAQDTLRDGILAMTGRGTELWTAEGVGKLVRRTTGLALVETRGGVGSPTAIAVDPENGALWLALPHEGRAVRIDRETASTRSVRLSEPFQVIVGTLRADPRIPSTPQGPAVD